MITLADIQTPQFMQAAGVCTDKPEFFELVDMAVDNLIIRGDWKGTVLPVRVCVNNGCVTWPRYVSEVRRVNSCAGSVPMRNVWYQFMEHGHSYGVDAWYNSWSMRGPSVCEGSNAFQFEACTYNDVYGTDCYIRVYPAAQEDAGATVTIFGLDGNGQPLMTRDATTQEWSEGITITVPTITPSVTYGSSAVTVSRIDRIVKSETQNDLLIYAYDSVNDWLYDLARYAPTETNPSYQRYQMNTGGLWNYQTCRAASTCKQSIVALVKLRNLPVRTANDLIYISNKRALLNAIRALKTEAGENVDQAQAQWAIAIEALNRQLENASPDAEMSVRNNIYGGRVMTQKAF